MDGWSLIVSIFLPFPFFSLLYFLGNGDGEKEFLRGLGIMSEQGLYKDFGVGKCPWKLNKITSLCLSLVRQINALNLAGVVEIYFG